jgi:hypothetical protein
LCRVRRSVPLRLPVGGAKEKSRSKMYITPLPLC